MIRIVTPPAAYPVTLAEAKEWAKCYADDTSQDGTINTLIAGMVNHAEHLTGQAFVERTLELSLPCFRYCIELPWAPLLGVDSIAYTDTSETAQTVSSADYEVDIVSKPGRVRPISTSAWPSIGTRFNPVRIQYRAGYRPVGSPIDLTDNSYLPGQLRIWMQARIATLYDQREQLVSGLGGIVAIPRDFADGLLDSLVIGSRLF